MKKLLRQFRSGEKGFTLIELLVVVAILGVLAAVVIPNVGKFMGTGTVQAANTEAHNVQTAVLAYMADESMATLDEYPEATGNAGTVGPNDEDDIPWDATTDNASVKKFITGDLQAVYTISLEGAIASANATTDGKWGDLIYTVGVGWAPAE